MGYDHPQWEMWESSKHGARYFMKEKGNLPPKASAPTCQFCHMPDGSHENRTAWGFLGVRLPLPEDKQWAADRVTILKALGVLNPETGEPTARLDAVKAVDLARLTEEAWRTEREKMVSRCKQCHSETYAREQLAMGDSIMQKTDRLLAEAIDMLLEEGLDNVFDRHARMAEAVRRAVLAWELELWCRDPMYHSTAVTAIKMPDGHNADAFRQVVLNTFNMSLGTGLN